MKFSKGKAIALIIGLMVFALGLLLCLLGISTASPTLFRQNWDHVEARVQSVGLKKCEEHIKVTTVYHYDVGGVAYAGTQIRPDYERTDFGADFRPLEQSLIKARDEHLPILVRVNPDDPHEAYLTLKPDIKGLGVFLFGVPFVLIGLVIIYAACAAEDTTRAVDYLDRGEMI